MSRDFDYELRATVNELATEARVVNLAEAAIRDGRHIVRRRRIVSAAATFAVLAVLVVPFALGKVHNSRLVQPGAAPAATAPSASVTPALPAPTPSPAVPVESVPGLVALPDGMLYGSIPRTGGDTLVFNRSTGQYLRVPVARAVPSPVGTLAAFNDGKRIGLINLETGVRHSVDGPVPDALAFDWAPDGTQLTYLTPGNKAGTVRVVILSVDKDYAGTIGQDIPCPGDCASAWLPNSTAIAVSGYGGKLPIRLVDPRTGSQRKGYEQVSGVLRNGHGVSADGALVVTEIGGESEVTVVQTGETILRLTADAAQTYWASGHDLLVVRPDGVVLYSIAGESLASYPFPTGTPTNQGTLPTLMHS